MTTFIDQNNELCYAIKCNDYSLLKNKIIEQKDTLSYYLKTGSDIFGYTITKNIPLSDIYKSNFYVVKFTFSEISSVHSDYTENLLKQLVQNLKNEIQNFDGYFNIRIPSHIVDLIKAFNEKFNNYYFCGGTVEEYTFGKSVDINIKDGMKLIFCDNDYIEKNKDSLLEITYKSFESYQGQYHISPVTDGKAGVIYREWINSEFKSLRKDTILVAEFQGVPCGFVVIDVGENHIDAKLAAVSSKYRGLGIYKSMYAFLINFAYEKRKIFLSSTQFDNFTTQCTWSGLGMKPFYSIYNMHVDNRRSLC